MTPSWSATVLELLSGAVLILCTLSLVAGIRRRDRRFVVAEADHVVMALAMVLMVFPETAHVVPPLAGAALFGALAAAWAGRLFVLLARGETPPSPITHTDCVTSPVHLVMANVAMMATYGLGGDVPVVFAVGAAALALYLVAYAGVVGADLALAATARSARARPGLVTAGSPAARPSGEQAPVVVSRAGPSTGEAGHRVRQACQALMSVVMAWMVVAMV